MLSGIVSRPWPGAEDSPARWMDTLAHDSPFDYEPVWRACAELGVIPAFHSGGQGWGTRMSTTNYLYNHLGSFAAAAAETAAACLVLRRRAPALPDLRFVFLEGGVAWAAALHADLLGHWEKRNGDAVLHYDPDVLDRGELERWFDEYATGRVHDRARPRSTTGSTSCPSRSPTVRSSTSSRRAASADRPTSPTSSSRQYHFGCEADDPMNALAFDRRLNPGGVRLKAVFGSDLGHWDVPDLRGVLPEAWELVDDGRITEDDFADFTFRNAVSLYGADFFGETVVEADVPPSLPTISRPTITDSMTSSDPAHRTPALDPRRPRARRPRDPDARRTLTWADLERETIQFGHGLEAPGPRARRPRRVVARNHVDFLVAVLGSSAPG